MVVVVVVVVVLALVMLKKVCKANGSCTTNRVMTHIYDGAGMEEGVI